MAQRERGTLSQYILKKYPSISDLQVKGNKNLRGIVSNTWMLIGPKLGRDHIADKTRSAPHSYPLYYVAWISHFLTIHNTSDVKNRKFEVTIFW